MRVQRVLSVDQEVEWLYAFDIHCNGFFPLFAVLFVLQYFLCYWLVHGGSYIATVVGNSLYAFALCYYWYITFLGYSGES